MHLPTIAGVLVAALGGLASASQAAGGQHPWDAVRRALAHAPLEQRAPGFKNAMVISKSWENAMLFDG